jgi:hypothetical protein
MPDVAKKPSLPAFNDEDNQANNKAGAYLCAFCQAPQLYAGFWFHLLQQT